MAKAKSRKLPRKSATPPPDAGIVMPVDPIITSDLTLHDLFQQQTSVMLERADLSDEQRQAILIGMSCPCCGAGGFSFTAKLKRRG